MKTSSVQIGDCAHILSGFAFKSELFTTDRKGMPVIRIRDVMRGRSETYYTGDYPETSIIENGDLLVGMDGEFNMARWNGGKALLNQRVCKIQPKQGVAASNYLLHALPIVLKRIEDRTPYVTVKHLSSQDLKDEVIPLPDLDEQHRIAGLLERADRLRRTRRYTLELSGAFLPAAFLQLFGDPVRNTMGLPVQVLSEVGEVQGGIQLSAKRNELPLKKPYLRVANVQRGFLDLSEIKQIGLTEPEFRRTVLQKDDLLLVEGNGNPEEVGRAGKWDGSISECVHQNHLIRVRCNQNEILPVFLLALLNSRRGMDYYLKHGRTTSGLVTISTGLVNDFPALIPPPSLQQKFAALVGEWSGCVPCNTSPYAKPNTSSNPYCIKPLNRGLSFENKFPRISLTRVPDGLIVWV